MQAGAPEEQLQKVISEIESLGYTAHLMRGVERNVIGCLGDERGKQQLKSLEAIAGVEKVVPILSPYKLAAKQLRQEPSVIKIADGVTVGGKDLLIIAGPCSVESEEQIVGAAKAVKASGANALRGGAFKPRTSTYAFQGLGEEGLRLLQVAKKETGLPIVTEIIDHHMLDMVASNADVLQVGARNMQNYSLLKELGTIKKPILLKRGLSATVEEWIMAAEYILAAGNPNVILCERGIRTFETVTRNTLDLNAVPAAKERTHLPILVDPSHGTGVAKYVSAMSKAAIACGAAGIIVEMHPNPVEALSDGAQSLDPAGFEELMAELNVISKALGLKAGTRV
jgi:3-deoxy-7-phosphoheptulonate synthase